MNPETGNGRGDRTEFSSPPVLDFERCAPAARQPGVRLHPSRLAEALAERKRRALPGGAIPHGFHYEGERQSELWQAVARAYQPAGLDQFYRGVFAELMLEGWLKQPFHLVGLGAGGAGKEAWLLEQLPERQGWRFTPVDVSEALAVESAWRVRDQVAEPVVPVVADLEAAEDLAGWLDEIDGGGESRWFTAFGLTPNSEPGVLLPRLRGLLREGDRLLLSANLLPAGSWESVRPEYDNWETRQWLTQVLLDWGLRSRLGEIEFVETQLQGVDALVARAAWKRDEEFGWEGRTYRSRRGEWLRIFFTIRYKLQDFVEVLEGYGLVTERSWEGAGGKEGLSLLRRDK